MLEQYRQDVRQDARPEENDPLSSSQAGMGKRKFLFSLFGAAFAVIFFLFLMGIFRGEDSETVAANVTDSQKSKVLEEQLQSIMARLEKLENEVHSHATAPVSVASNSTPQVSQEPVIAQAMPELNSAEDAIAMTNQAFRKLIAFETEKQKAGQEIAQVDALPKAKTIKPKKAKAKPVATLASDQTYTVQRGDTLSKISQRFFGTANRWKTIYEANKERIPNVNHLKVGTSLVIPKDSKQ